MSENPYSNLPYNPADLPRELEKFYLSMTGSEIEEILKELGLTSTDQLFSHIPENVRHNKNKCLGAHLEYSDLIKHMEDLAAKNNTATSFVGDGLKDYKSPKIVDYVSSLRGLTTAYTPYQPERSQGTLWTLWMYSSTLSMLTGFEAVNASFYDRSTCLYESLCTAKRIVKKSTTVLVSESIYPGDLEVLLTMAKETDLIIEIIPFDKDTGLTNIEKLKERMIALEGTLAAFAFPQVNSFGLLEDVNELTDLCTKNKVQSIGIIDPMLLATGGLIPPVKFGSENQGCNMIVGEGQHLAIKPNFGGPGLGIFGIRFNENNKSAIRSTAGRYIGKAKDVNGNEALSMVLSTREQHIRREKANSNICSNQSFIATLAGAAILGRGEKGMQEAISIAKENARETTKTLLGLTGIQLAFPYTPFYNEVTFEMNQPVLPLIQKARAHNLHLGVDVSDRIEGNKNLLQISFFDTQDKSDCLKLITFLTEEFGSDLPEDKNTDIPEIPNTFDRDGAVNLPSFSHQELISFYNKLDAQNISPDDNIYPLGSCTMKYNPHINDYAATLKGFTDIHPQAPLEDAQGCLEVLYEIQEMFKGITGLPGVTTQPVAGAQGELVGLKLFQAYHRHNGEAGTRNIILIPHSAHGTNPASASVAGYKSTIINGEKVGIVSIEASSNGQINLEQLKEVTSKYQKQIAGIMVTNPNTSGILEINFKEMANIVHQTGGLVYMDGANMNAIAGHLDLNKLGVDAVHNNLHKTWTIPHGGGGPGDAIVAVSDKLIDFLPGIQVTKNNDVFHTEKPSKSIGSFHRHFGNFAHKIRCYAYLKALGDEGVRSMSEVAVLSANYLYHKLDNIFPTLPESEKRLQVMHEFIITLSSEDFTNIQNAGIKKSDIVAKVGKLFLDFGMHAPTVAFPEVYGLMIEPTESFSKGELDKFLNILDTIKEIIKEHPEVLQTVPHFTPVKKVDEVSANKKLQFFEVITTLPEIPINKINPKELADMEMKKVKEKIITAHKEAMALRS